MPAACRSAGQTRALLVTHEINALAMTCTSTGLAAFRGPADRRWWHVELGDDAVSWSMGVRVDEITGVRFVREPYPFLPFQGESLTVQFLGPGGDAVLYCYAQEAYDGQRMRPEGLAAWQALRERYGNSDESRSIEAPSWSGCLKHHDHWRGERRAATGAATPMHGPGLTPTT